MIIQVQQLIKTALQDIGAVAKSEMPTSDEMTDGLVKLNFMIDAWSVRSLMVLGTVLEGFPLTAGTVCLHHRTGRRSSTRPGLPRSRTPISGTATTRIRRSTSLTSDEYDAIEDKAIGTGRPQGLFFDPGLTQQASFLGTIYLYPAPDASTPYTLYVGEQKALTEFVNLTDTVTFQPAYYEALEYSLAVRLWPQYHSGAQPIENDLKALAAEAVRTIETMNARRVTASIEVPGSKRGSYNIYTGQP